MSFDDPDEAALAFRYGRGCDLRSPRLRQQGGEWSVTAQMASHLGLRLIRVLLLKHHPHRRLTHLVRIPPWMPLLL
jgi:hypothetical protein